MLTNAFTCEKTFCNKIRLSVGVKSEYGAPALSFSATIGRSKNKYRHLTSVEGTDTDTITSTWQEK